MKNEIKIIGAPTTPELKLDEIKNKIKATKDACGVVDVIYQEISTLLMTKNEMDYAKKDFMDKVNEALENFNKGYDEINSLIKDAKEIALTTADITKTVSAKVTKYGEVVEKISVSLPKGIKYTNGRTSWEYDEKQVPEQFFKKTLKKNDVKKAVQSGELPFNIVTVKVSKPSISFDTALVRDGAATLLEAGSDESV